MKTKIINKEELQMRDRQTRMFVVGEPARHAKWRTHHEEAHAGDFWGTARIAHVTFAAWEDRTTITKGGAPRFDCRSGCVPLGDMACGRRKQMILGKKTRESRSDPALGRAGARAEGFEDTNRPRKGMRVSVQVR
jgi:hypothetical protein